MKRKLSARELVISINSGMSYQELLEHYGLSEVHLDRALRKLVDARLVAPRALPRKTTLDTILSPGDENPDRPRAARPMAPLQPNLKDIVASIRVGYSRKELCKEYGLHDEELNPLFERTTETGLLTTSEIPPLRPKPLSARPQSSNRGTRKTDTPEATNRRLITIALCLIIIGGLFPAFSWFGMPKIPSMVAEILRYILYLGFALMLVHMIVTPGSWKAKGMAGSDGTWVVTTAILVCLIATGYWLVLAGNTNAARAVESLSHPLSSADHEYCRVQVGCFGARNSDDVETIETLIYSGQKTEVEDMLQRGSITFIRAGKTVEVIDYSIAGKCQIKVPGSQGYWWVHPEKLSPYSL